MLAVELDLLAWFVTVQYFHTIVFWGLHLMFTQTNRTRLPACLLHVTAFYLSRCALLDQYIDVNDQLSQCLSRSWSPLCTSQLKLMCTSYYGWLCRFAIWCHYCNCIRLQVACYNSCSYIWAGVIYYKRLAKTNFMLETIKSKWTCYFKTVKCH
jgi:hypothetical protein